MIAMALLLQEKLYYTEMDCGQEVTLGPDRACRLMVPELRKRLSVVCGERSAEITISDGTVSPQRRLHSPEAHTVCHAEIGEITVIDYESHIAVAFSHVSQSERRFYFDNNCRVGLGRSGKRLRDGTENAIVVKLPFVSSAHMEFVSNNGKLFAVDKGSKNGTFVNGEKITRQEIRPGDVISVLTFRMVYDGNALSFFNAGSALSAKDTAEALRTEYPEEKGAVIFERSVRLRKSIQPENITIPSPPQIGEKPKIDYLTTFLPAFVTVAVGVVIACTGNATSLLYSLPASLSGVVVSVINYRKQIREYSSNNQNAQENFREKIAEAEEKLQSFSDRQRSVMDAESPEISRLLNAAQTRNTMLWNRSPGDEDFLSVRLGIGKVPTLADIRMDIPPNCAKSENADICRGLKNQYSYVENAPICCDIRKSRVTGIVGKTADTDYLLRNLVMQLAACCCYTDLRIIFLGGGADAEWISALPHSLGISASGKAEADRVLESVFSVLREREKAASERSTYGRAPEFSPYFLLIVGDPSLLGRNHSTQRYFIDGAAPGVGMIMAVENLSQLPMNCETVVRVNKNQGEVFPQEDASRVTAFTMENVSRSAGLQLVEAIRNVRVREDGPDGAEKTVPTKCSFYEMLGIKSISQLDLKKRWQESDVCKALKAPLGIGAEGIVELNISGDDTADGPHGLVAGMTGSGKSETIVSYLLALTTLYSPLDLSLVIIDFKGGAMCNKFREIPHLVGSVTNLADKEIARSLKTLNAELKHRQQLLQAASDITASHDVDNINKYTSLFKAGKVREPMPHMLMVVDEFAELKAQYPEFLEKLVSAARIGRSLGIHLILATQKPAGQVSDQIWSNSKFRISLKVQTEQDSKEVIKSPLAARIKEAGRAYLMVGNNERFELFQSGYSGVPDAAGGSTERITQFSAAVNCIASFCRREKIPRMPELFLKPLPDQAAFPSDPRPGDAAGTVAVGIYDDPERKCQGVHTVSLTGSNLMVIGSSQTGKTNLLQCIIRGLAEQYSPADAAIYILDFASQLLRKYEGLNHVGGVVTSMEDEKLSHFLQLIEREFTVRKEKFAAAGVSSLAAYRETGRRDLPHIVVVIDNFTALKELYFQEDAELVRLCRDGLSVGITVVAANSQTKGIGYKYLSYFDERIALYNNDSGEYGTLFDHCRETVEKLPGRCLIMHDGHLLDCQTFLAFSGSLNGEIASFVARNQEQYGSQRAARIPELPASLTAEALMGWCPDAYRTRYSAALGLDYETVAPVVRNLKKMGCLFLSGGTAEAQSSYLSGLIRQLDSAYSGKVKAWILDGIDRALQPLASLSCVTQYSINAAAAPEIISELEQMVKGRMAMLELGETSGFADAQLLLLVVNNPTVADIMNGNRTALASYTALISKYKDMSICTVVSNAPNGAFVSSEFYKKSMENKQFLWFDNLSVQKIVTLPYAVGKKFSKKIGPGDAYLFRDTECVKLKIPET